MHLYLDWSEAVLLHRSKATGSYELDFEQIPKAAGIYVFAQEDTERQSKHYMSERQPIFALESSNSLTIIV